MAPGIRSRTCLETHYDAPLATSECEHNSASVDQGGFGLRDIGMNLAAISLRDLDDMVADPLCWFVIGGPVIILVIVAVFLFQGEEANKGRNKAKNVRPSIEEIVKRSGASRMLSIAMQFRLVYFNNSV